MQETPKESAEDEGKLRGEAGTWEHDQSERGYYYDDAHGYETYCEDDDDEDDDEAPSSPGDV